MYSHKFYFPTTSMEPSLNTREFWTARGTTMKNFWMKLWKRLSLKFFSLGEWKCLADLLASCCMVIWGLIFWFFCTSELLYPNMKIRQRLIRARPNFYMISDNPNVSLGIVDCSFYTRGIALKDYYHKKRMKKLAYTPVEFNNLGTLGGTFINPARQIQFIQENIFNNAPVRQINIAMNTKSAFTRSYTENPFWYQHFDLRQNRILTGGQPIVDFDAADNCRLYVTIMKTMNFQDDIPQFQLIIPKTTMY